MSINLINRPGNNTPPGGPPLPPYQGAERPRQIGDSIEGPRVAPRARGRGANGCCTSFFNFFRDLWHRFLRLIRVEAAEDYPPRREPVGIRLDRQRHLDDAARAEERFQEELAHAMSLQVDCQRPSNDAVRANEQFEEELARAMSLQDPEHALPIAPLYTVPPQLLFSDANKLLAATDKYFADPTASAPKRLDFSEIPFPITLVQLFEALLKKYEGICIGESHNDSAAKYILCYFMPLFVRLGVDTLYIEGYPYQAYQKDFDHYFKPTTRVDQIPSALERRVRAMNSMQNGRPMYTEMDVITSAKKAGIRRVICIDTTASQNIFSTNRAINRTAAMNFQAKCIIDPTIGENGGKCLIWAGAFHMSRGGGVPSLEQLCGFPSFYAKDGEGMPLTIPENALIDPTPHSALMRKVAETLRGRPVEYDFKLTMPTPLKRAP